MPKRPIFGIWAQKFEEVIHLLEDLENGRNSAEMNGAFGNPLGEEAAPSPGTGVLPSDDPRFMGGLKNCLGFAVDMLFQGDTHSARNALAVVAYMLVHAAEIDLWLRIPRGESASAPGDWLRVDYYDPETQTDLWDALTFSSSSSSGGSAAMRDFLAGHSKGLDPLVAMWLERLTALADNMDLWVVYGAEIEKTESEYEAIWTNYSALLNTCAAEEYGCADFLASGEIVSEADALGVVHDDGKCFTLIQAMLLRCRENRKGVSASLAAYDSLGCESGLVETSAVLALLRKAVLDFTRKVDQAEQEAEKAEAYARAREEVASGDKHIWEIIPCCLEDVTLGKLEGSLKAWWGSKKYIIASACAIINLPVIIGSAGAGVIPAIYGFVTCFLEGMIGGVWEIVADFGGCLFSGCES
jgi:hypothetical protein